MNSVLNPLKRFVSNKNTVTIIGVILVLVLLYWGYSTQVNNILKANVSWGGTESTIAPPIPSYPDLGSQYTSNKVEEYFEKYLIPMLNKLNDNKIITYNVNSKDKEIQLLTNKTTELIKLFINNKIGNCINFSLFKYAFNEEETYRFNFLYNDNENARNDFVEIVKDFLENNYNKMELKTMSKETMEQYIEAVEK